jgi:hypothetical protein
MMVTALVMVISPVWVMVCPFQRGGKINHPPGADIKHRWRRLPAPLSAVFCTVTLLPQFELTALPRLLAGLPSPVAVIAAVLVKIPAASGLLNTPVRVMTPPPLGARLATCQTKLGAVPVLVMVAPLRLTLMLVTLTGTLSVMMTPVAVSPPR